MKRSVLLLFCFAFSLPLYAIQALPGALPDDQKVGMSLSPFLTVMSGYSDELVFDESSDPYPYLSQLTWEISPSLVAGQSFSFMVGDIFSLNLAMGTAVNGNSGEMTDHDWIEDYFDDVDTGWTHESVSDINFTSSLLLDMNGAFRLYHSRKLSADLLVGYKFFKWGWTDEITSISYPSGDYDYLIGSNGIDYDVEYRMPYGGVNLELQRGFLSWGGVFLYSPFVSAEDHDHHILRGLHFYDSFSFGNYFGLSLFIRYSSVDWISLRLSCDLDYVPEFKGDTRVYNESGTLTGYYPDEAGVEYLAYGVTVALEFNL